MRQRAEQVAQTRERIVEAAVELFAEQGARATTMASVARAADVSPATVTNHFATADLLLEAVVAHVMADIEIPDATIFAGVRSQAARIRVLTESMFAFYGRTTNLFDLLRAELTEMPVLAKAEAEFWRSIRRLYAAALADTADPVLAKATAGLVHPATFSALRAAGLSLEDAAGVVVESLTHMARKARR